jgi:hypothetical protein
MTRANKNKMSRMLRITEGLSALAFLYFFVCYPDMDLNSIARNIHINAPLFVFLLASAAGLGIWLSKYSRIIAGFIFIIVFMIFKTQLAFVEMFTVDPAQEDSSTTPNEDITKAMTAQDIETAKQFLYKQVESDPNKTPLEKEVVNNLINTYFGKSDKLKDLMNFNVSALVANPIPGDQKLL